MNRTLLADWHQARHFSAPNLDMFANVLCVHEDHELAAVLDGWVELRPPTPAELNAGIREGRERQARLAGRTAATAAMQRTRAEHEARKAEWALTRRLDHTPITPPARRTA